MGAGGGAGLGAGGGAGLGAGFGAGLGAGLAAAGLRGGGGGGGEDAVVGGGGAGRGGTSSMANSRRATAAERDGADGPRKPLERQIGAWRGRGHLCCGRPRGHEAEGGERHHREAQHQPGGSTRPPGTQLRQVSTRPLDGISGPGDPRHPHPPPQGPRSIRSSGVPSS